MGAPYSEPEVKRAFDIVRNWSAQELERHVMSEMGSEVIGLLGALARSAFPDRDEAELSHVLHLMVLSFMMRVELERPGAGKAESGSSPA